MQLKTCPRRLISPLIKSATLYKGVTSEPSITSTTLTELTDSDLAMSCAIPVILLALVPGAG